MSTVLKSIFVFQEYIPFMIAWLIHGESNAILVYVVGDWRRFLILEKSVADNASQSADHEVVYYLLESGIAYHFKVFDSETEERYLQQVTRRKLSTFPV